MAAKTTRRKFSLAEKVKIIDKIEHGRKQTDVAQELCISTSTVNEIWKSRVKIMQDFSEFSPSAAKIRKIKFPKTETALTKWFDDQRSRNIPLSGPLLKEKAKEFAVTFKEEGFKASDGWIEGWKKRHGIRFSSSSEEAGAAADELMKHWLENVWPTLQERYPPEDVYNAGETGLFYKLMPAKTMHRKGIRCTGGKLAKERITILLCCNATGTDKLRPLVIGKYETPRCFKGINKKSLPVDYYANSAAWMTQAVFTSWLRKTNSHMKTKKRHILLLIDNCRPHEVCVNLSNIKLVYFPPNLTSKLQPLDQGIINEMKKFYRSILVQKIFDSMDKNQVPLVDVFDAIMIVTSAWKKVQATVIHNCFLHVQLFSRNLLSEVVDHLEPEGVNLDTEISEEQLKLLNLGDATLDDYFYVDNQVMSCEQLVDTEIIPVIEHDGSADELALSDGEDDPEIIRESVSISKTQEALEVLKLFSAQQVEELGLKSVVLKEDAVPSIFSFKKQESSPCQQSLQRQTTNRRRKKMEECNEAEGNTMHHDNTISGNEEISIVNTTNDTETSCIQNPLEDSEMSHVVTVKYRNAATQTPHSPAFSIERFKDDSSAVHYYTGLENYDRFQSVLSTLGPDVDHLILQWNMCKDLSVPDQFFLTLIKLRQNKPDRELGYLFEISPTTVLNVFVTWLNFMYFKWGKLDTWPSQDIVNYFMSLGFKKSFSKMRVSLDTMEVPSETPHAPVAQQATFSNYKDCNTLEVFVDASPGELITYKSAAYGGTTSDQELFECSTLMDICERKDSIMTDCRFTVQDLVMNTPTFLKDKSQLPELATVNNEKIPSQRLHIEHLIALSKTYKILCQPLNSQYVELGTQIMSVCLMLCDFKPGIVRNTC